MKLVAQADQNSRNISSFLQPPLIVKQHNGRTNNTKKIKEDYDDLLEQSDPVFTKKKYVG
jgi:hypothetical protein